MSLLSCAEAYETRLMQAPASQPGKLYTTDDHCRRLVSLPDYSGACDLKGQ